MASISASTLIGAPLGAGLIAMSLHGLMVGALAGALDAGMQGLAIGMELLKHFSLENMIETALAAGIFAVGNDGNLSKNLLLLTKASVQGVMTGAEDLSEQLIEMGLGVRHRLDILRMLLAMANGAADAVLASWSPPHLNEDRVAKDLYNDILSTALNALIGFGVTGSFDLDKTLLQALGSFVGQQITGWLSMPGASTAKPPTDSVEQGVEGDSGSQDYHSALLEAQPGLTYESPSGMLGIHDLSWQDFVNDSTNSSNQVIGSAQSPKSLQTAKTSPGIAPPNNYVTITARVRQGLEILGKGQLGLQVLKNPDWFLGKMIPWLDNSIKLGNTASTLKFFGVTKLQTKLHLFSSTERNVECFNKSYHLLNT